MNKYTDIEQIEKAFRLEKKLELDSPSIQTEIAKKNLGIAPISLTFKDENGKQVYEKFQATDYDMQHIYKLNDSMSSKLEDCSEYLRAVNASRYGVEYIEDLITYLTEKLVAVKKYYIKKLNTHDYVGSEIFVRETRDKKLAEVEKDIFVWNNMKEKFNTNNDRQDDGHVAEN